MTEQPTSGKPPAVQTLSRSHMSYLDSFELRDIFTWPLEVRMWGPGAPVTLTELGLGGWEGKLVVARDYTIEDLVFDRTETKKLAPSILAEPCGENDYRLSLKGGRPLDHMIRRWSSEGGDRRISFPADEGDERIALNWPEDSVVVVAFLPRSLRSPANVAAVTDWLGERFSISSEPAEAQEWPERTGGPEELKEYLACLASVLQRPHITNFLPFLPSLSEVMP